MYYGVGGFLDDLIDAASDVGEGAARDAVVSEWRGTVRPYNPWLEHKGRFVGERVGEGIKKSLAIPVFSSTPTAPPPLKRRDRWVKALVDPVTEPLERGIAAGLEPALKKALYPWMGILIGVGFIGGWWWRGRRSRK